MNSEDELILSDINPTLRRFRTTTIDDNRLSLAAIAEVHVSWNNSKLHEPTSNLHHFGCSRTRQQRNLKTGYRLGHAHETTMSSDNDEEVNDLDSDDDEIIESHSESGNAESVKVQTGPASFSTLSLEGNASVNMSDNDGKAQTCQTDDPHCSVKCVDISNIHTEVSLFDQLNSSEGSVMTNSSLNCSDQKMCADVQTVDQSSNDDTLDVNLQPGEQDYPKKLRRKKTAIEDDNRLAFYDDCFMKDKVFLQKEQINSESQEARLSNTSEPQMKKSSKEYSKTAMESNPSKDLNTVQPCETKPKLDQEHMAILDKLKKIKTNFADDNRLSVMFENDTNVQVTAQRDYSKPFPVLQRNSPISKSSGKATHRGPVKAFKSDFQRPFHSETAKEDKKAKGGDSKQDIKISKQKSARRSEKSGLSSDIPSAQGSANQGEISDLDHYEWYFKDINRAESEKILEKDGNNGCFMVRDSSRPGMYSVSLLHKSRRKGQVKHYLISKSMDDKFYLIKEQEFASIPELVDYHKIHVGCIKTLLVKPPTRMKNDIVRGSIGFVSDSDDTMSSSEDSLLSEDEREVDQIVLGQDDKSLDPEDSEINESEWDEVLQSEVERCFALKPLPIGGGRNTVLCIDISASISGAWDQMKRALEDFLEGLEENAKEAGPEENIAIITFGHETKVALTLTNDYMQVRKTLDQLCFDGVSPLCIGMGMVLIPLICIQVTRPIHVDLHGIYVNPRAVVFTDGKATPVGMISGEDECPEKNCDEVQARLMQKCEQMCYENKVEFVFVPIGEANKIIFDSLAELPNVKFEKYTNMKRLTSLSHNMGLACQIGGHMLAGIKKSDDVNSVLFLSLVSAISPKLTSHEMHDMLEVVKTFHTQKKQEPESESSPSVEQDTFEELKTDTLPPLGTRVRRGSSWKRGMQDSSGPGTITGHSKQDDNTIYVQWDNGFKYSYKFGSEIEIVDRPKPPTVSKLDVRVGCVVRRGTHWQWGKVDGEPGALGTVYRVERDNTVHVRWHETGNKGNYRYGRDGMYDVIVCNPDDPYESQVMEEVLNKRNQEKKEVSSHLKFSSTEKRSQSSKRTGTVAKDKKSISWYKEPILKLDQPAESNIDLEGIPNSFFKMNENVSGVLSSIGETNSTENEKPNLCEQNNENVSWKVKELEDISLEKEKTWIRGVVSESGHTEQFVLPDKDGDKLGESNSIEKFENDAFFNNLEVNIGALETSQESLMKMNLTSFGDLSLSFIGEQSSIKSMKLNPCDQNNKSWDVKQLQDFSLEKEKTLNSTVVNESKLAEKSVLPNFHGDELRESNSMDNFQTIAIFNDLEMNIGALVQEPYIERTSSAATDKLENNKMFNNFEDVKLISEKDQNISQNIEESNNTEDKTSNTGEGKSDTEISNETDRLIQDISCFEDGKEQTLVRYQEDQILTTSPVPMLSGVADFLDYSKPNDIFENSYDTDSKVISELSYSNNESQSSTSSSCADENHDYRDISMQEISKSSTTCLQKWKPNSYLEVNKEQKGFQNSNEDGIFSSNLLMSNRTMSQETLFTQDSSYDWRGSMSEISDTSLYLGEGEVMPQWVWLNQDNMWEPFSRDTNMKLEKSFRRNPKSTTVIQIGIVLYRIIFSRMIQRNIETKEIFKIQRHEISN